MFVESASVWVDYKTKTQSTSDSLKVSTEMVIVPQSQKK